MDQNNPDDNSNEEDIEEMDIDEDADSHNDDEDEEGQRDEENNVVTDLVQLQVQEGEMHDSYNSRQQDSIIECEDNDTVGVTHAEIECWLERNGLNYLLKQIACHDV